MRWLFALLDVWALVDHFTGLYIVKGGLLGLLGRGCAGHDIGNSIGVIHRWGDGVSSSFDSLKAPYFKGQNSGFAQSGKYTEMRRADPLRRRKIVRG